MAADRMAEDWESRAISLQERAAFYSHIRECSQCDLRSRQHLLVRNALKSLPETRMPSDLTVRLRTVAARERAAKSAAAADHCGSRKSRFPEIWFSEASWTRLKLNFQDVMRPLAVPLATGICSAIVLFSMLVPNLTMEQKGRPDVPTVLSTKATVKNMAPLGFSGEAVVDLIVDGNGRAIDYSIVSEVGVDKEVLRRSIENTLLFTVFTPGTTFGQPMPGRIRLTFRNSVIDVRG